MKHPFRNTLIPGACQEVLRDLPAGCVDLTVTSPPYDSLREYQGFTFPFEDIARALWRITKSGGVVVWVVGDETVDGGESLTSFSQALFFKSLGFKVDTMIYQKKNPAPVLTSTRYTNAFEYMFVLFKGTPNCHNLIQVPQKEPGKKYVIKRNNATSRDGGAISTTSGKTQIAGLTRPKTNIWTYSPVSGQEYHDHPAAFPESLVRDHIQTWTNPGDLVLDPMCGSGTTMAVAQEQGRDWIGIDMSEEYLEISMKRISGVKQRILYQQRKTGRKVSVVKKGKSLL